MDKYAQLNTFDHDHKLQVYIYAFVYVDPRTMPVKYHIYDTKPFIENYKKM